MLLGIVVFGKRSLVGFCAGGGFCARICVLGFTLGRFSFLPSGAVLYKMVGGSFIGWVVARVGDVW